MNPTLLKLIQAAGLVAAENHIEETRKIVYRLSAQLPNNEGYEFLKQYDKAIVCAKVIERNKQ